MAALKIDQPCHSDLIAHLPRDVPSRSTPARPAGRCAVGAALGVLLILGVALEAAQETIPQPAGENPPLTSAETKPENQDQLAALMDEELRLAQLLLEEYPDNEHALELMGNVCSRRGKTDQALRFWERAVAINPKRTTVYVKMASLALQVDDYEKAVALFRKVLDLNPKIEGAHRNIASALMKLGQYKQSVQEIQEEIQISGESTECHFLLGQAYRQLQNFERARDHYERVIAQEPDHINAYYGLYQVCSRLKQSEAAMRYLAQFKKLKDDRKEAIRYAGQSDLECGYRSLAKFYFDATLLCQSAGITPNAKEVLDKTLALGGNDLSFLQSMVNLYGAMGRLPAVLALYQRMAQLQPEEVSYHLQIGILSGRLNRADQAEQAFRKAIQLAPEHYAGYQGLARLYLRRKEKPGEARIMAEMAVQRAARADTYYDLGLACYANRDLDAALEALGKAVALDPKNSTYRKALEQFQKLKK